MENSLGSQGSLPGEEMVRGASNGGISGQSLMKVGR